MSWKPDDVRRMLMNPLYAITVSPTLSTPHAPMVTKEQWVAANAKMIKELGAERWLTELLAILETGGATTPSES